MDTLSRLALKYGTDKHGCYSGFYDFILSDFPVVRLLEIGILKGASLRMWRDYFPGAEIYGMDADAATMFEEPGIKTFHGNQAVVNDLQRVAEAAGPFDLIIDDGSHEPEDQLIPALFLRDYLRHSGLYIIEDVHPKTAWKVTERLDAEGIEYTHVQHHLGKRTGRCILIRKGS